MATSHPDSVAKEPQPVASRPEPSPVPLRDPKTRERRRGDPPYGKLDQIDPPATREPGEPAVPGDPESDPPDPNDPMRSGT